MAYIGNNLKVAYPNYEKIDDISASFNGVATSFTLLVRGSAPSVLPVGSQQCLISVGGAIQKPDDTGTEGFRLSGGNIIFSSAPAAGESFFGVILAGANYVNVGGAFVDGSASVPSLTFINDTDTGIFRSGSGGLAFTSNGVTVGTLPTGPGTSSQVLSTDGLGTLSWSDRGRMTLATSQSTGSGTAIDFTGIPSWVKRVTVMLNGVSTNGISIVEVRLGTSSGILASTYTSSSSTTTTALNSSSGFCTYGASSSDVRYGAMVITTTGSNNWIAYGNNITGTGPNQNYPFAGGVTLPGTLDRLRLTTVNGTDSFDSGTVNILYEG